jgi:hypothetical protein
MPIYTNVAKARTAVAVATIGTLVLAGATAAHSQAAPLRLPTARTVSQAAPAAKTHGLAALRQSSSRFRNLTRAENAGYGFFTDTKGIACIAMPAMPGMPSPGAMGVHFVKGALVGDPTEKVRQPEAMVYRIDKNGKLTLAAAEYVVIQSAWDATHSSPPKLFGHRFMLTPAGNRYGLPAFYSLHAWAWYHNPSGTFSMWNPRVTC